MRERRAAIRDQQFLAIEMMVAFPLIDGCDRTGGGEPVAGFDDIDMAGWPHYALSTFRYPVDAVVGVRSGFSRGGCPGG